MSALQGNPRYVQCERLGESHGYDLLVRALDKASQSRKNVLIKLLERGEASVRNTVKKELLNHRLVHHPNVCELYDVFLTSQHLCIVTEYCSEGDLFSYLEENGPLQEDHARRLFKQLICAVECLHNLDIACRDIRLETVLLNRDEEGRELVKIADLGTSKDLAAEAAKTRLGTPDYMAPEVLKLGYNGSYDGRACDIWSAGVMLYTLLCGQYPFSGPGDDNMTQDAKTMRIIMAIMNSTLTFPPDLTQECVDFIQGLLQQDPVKRLTLLDIHMHPWFKKGGPCTSTLDHNTPSKRPPQHILHQHQQRLEETWAEGRKVLPYGAPAVEYVPLLTPKWESVYSHEGLYAGPPGSLEGPLAIQRGSYKAAAPQGGPRGGPAMPSQRRLCTNSNTRKVLAGVSQNGIMSSQGVCQSASVTGQGVRVDSEDCYEPYCDDEGLGLRSVQSQQGFGFRPAQIDPEFGFCSANSAHGFGLTPAELLTSDPSGKIFHGPGATRADTQWGGASAHKHTQSVPCASGFLEKFGDRQTDGKFRSQSTPQGYKGSQQRALQVSPGGPVDTKLLLAPQNWPRLYDDEGNIRRESMQVDNSIRETVTLNAKKNASGGKSTGWTASLKSALKSVGKKK